MDQTGCTRAVATQALANADNDLDIAIMDILCTMAGIFLFRDERWW